MAKKTSYAIKNIYKVALLGILAFVGLVLRVQNSSMGTEHAYADAAPDPGGGGGIEGGVSGADSGTGVGGDSGDSGDGPTGP